MRVRDVLAGKGSTVATVAPTATIVEVVAALAEHNIGALVVTEDGSGVAGIVSERDVVRALHAVGPGLLTQPVSGIMTSEVNTCGPTDEIQTLAKTMTDGRFRHMPVVVDGALAGIVTIGDIVKNRIDELETERSQLVDYISAP